MDSDSDYRADAVFETALCYVAVWLGVLASIALMTWALSGIQQALMAMSPIALLMVIGHVVNARALDDWKLHCSQRLVVRFVRAFVIGFAWPLWVGRRSE